MKETAAESLDAYSSLIILLLVIPFPFRLLMGQSLTSAGWSSVVFGFA
jgi:hypothetical protein